MSQESQGNRWRAFLRKARGSPFISSLVVVFVMWLVISYLVSVFEVGAQGGNITSFWDSLWWGIVTILTVGYGDRYPVTLFGRIWAGVLMLGGVAGIGILTAKISSFFLEKALRERKGLVETENLNDHLVICGWKVEMHALLLQILNSNLDLSPSQIVLVNNVSEAEIETLHEFPQLKKIGVIHGDFFSVDILKRAAPHRARKIMILADATPNARGQIPTRTEADSKTVMTAMAVNNLAKGVPIVAEVLEPHMDQYLKLAHVHEIIYTRDYSRLMLAMSSFGTGVTNIFHDLLASDSDYFLITMDLPSGAVGKTYRELREMIGRDKIQLLGILENSGNSYQAKEQALKKAQQTPNVQELVKNLRQVKGLKFNQPIFSPPDNYVVPDGAMGIVIKQREKRNDLEG